MQRSFFTQLQFGALAFKNSGQATEIGDINYLALWELLFESELLKENTALASMIYSLKSHGSVLISFCRRAIPRRTGLFLLGGQ